MAKAKWYETSWRSFIKSFLYRFVGTITTAVIVLLLSGTWKLAIWTSAIEFVSKIFIYWGYERIWDKIMLGKKTRDDVLQEESK